MKKKTSITLSSEVLVEIDRLAGSKSSRSALIERVLRRYLRERVRAAINARDL
jgi:metal-responsive CopG/Arc/MetJ family transcriptional regulator